MMALESYSPRTLPDALTTASAPAPYQETIIYNCILYETLEWIKTFCSFHGIGRVSQGSIVSPNHLPAEPDGF